MVSMATGEGYTVDDVMELLPRAYPFREVTREDVKDVLCMLAGDYEHDRNVPVRPRVLYDRIHEKVEGDPYSRMLAVSAAGTIPDKGLFSVKTENGVKLGEIDEEFVFEARVGDKFLLGTFAWKISRIQKDSVIVTPSSTYGAIPPFYKAEVIGRRLQTGMAFGSIIRRLGSAYYDGTLEEELRSLGLDNTSAHYAEDVITRQIETTGALADDKTIVVEHFTDDTGSHQLMVHSVFGRQVNAPLAILAKEAAKKHIKTNITCFEDDDGFLLFPYGDYELPEGLLQEIMPETARPILEAVLPSTPVFNMTFRYNAAHALMMGVRKSGRQPLWLQRIRSAQMLDTLMPYKNHPLIRETKRECLEDYWDLEGVEYILMQIRSGEIKVREVFLEKPSPMSLPLRRQTEGTLMYEYFPTTNGIHIATEEALKQVHMIAPEPEQLALMTQRRRLPEDEKQLHSLLMIEGDLMAGDVEVPIEWLEALAKEERACYIEPGLWIAAEHWDKYNKALVVRDKEARLQILLRAIRYRGPLSGEELGERYLWSEREVEELIQELLNQNSIVISDGLYYHKELYERARMETIKNRRKQIKTQPPERFAAMLIDRMKNPAVPPMEQLEAALSFLCDQPYAANLWESVLLPTRVQGYRPELLDTVLSQGNYYWSLDKERGVSFHRYEDIDWEADLTPVMDGLTDKERTIYDALLKRGASFMQRLSGLLEGESPYDTLMQMAEKGLVTADSFLPVRQWITRDKLNSGSVKQRAGARSKAMTTGRWELVRPSKESTVEEILERNFDRAIILCRETIQGIPWAKALETLRIWEYTGRIRRGYFIEGLSGVQFVRDKEFTKMLQDLEQPWEYMQWLSAIDPAQPWGKILGHLPERAFLNVPGSMVAIRNGLPVAVFERQGKTLRIFEEEGLGELLQLFAKDFSKRRIYPDLNRIVVKQYPGEAGTALAEAGFRRELQDYVLYRGII